MKLITIRLFIILAIVSVLAVFYYPIKIAKKEPQYDDYISCKIVRTTDFEWAVVDESNNDAFVDYVKIDNEHIFREYNFGIEYGDNVYYFYGKYTGEKVIDGMNIRTFEFYDWDIKYPIKRNSLINWIIPSRYLCKLDIY